MKPEQQRIAIAQACGWTAIKGCHGFASIPTGIDPLDVLRDDIPDYLNDLNAMHEVEKMLTDAQWIVYISKLHNDVTIYPTRKAVSATAAQRAEALLRTIGKWVDE